MCGIVSILNLQGEPEKLRKRALRLAKQIRHRGPDWSGVYSDEYAILAHERLSIVGIEHGAQPLFDAEKNVVLAVNGEIYNHLDIKKEKYSSYSFQTSSDCEVIIPLYKEHGVDFLNLLNGIYAFVLYDKSKQAYLIGRDPMGVVPLYWGWDQEGNRYVASEMKALIEVCNQIEEFPPGCFFWSDEQEPTRFYQPEWFASEPLPTGYYSPEDIAEALEQSVKRQLMCDVPYGVLLSGGLDSSVIAAIAAKYASRRVETDSQSPAWWPQLHSFSIGLKGSPDLDAAQKVAEHINTIHHSLEFTIQEGLDAISDVIYHLETYDVTTIRAATPMYLLSRKIKAMGIKMLLSGEGADEIFGGYLYFHKAPNPKEFHEETVRKLQQLHMYDCLRANKSTSAWGIEARVPFLDLEFLKVAMNLAPSEKMIGVGQMEKHILRKAFEGVLPDEILWRQKEQFSDGVGYGWIDGLKDHSEKEVSEKQFSNAKFRFPNNTPLTKEAYWFRAIFDSYYPGEHAARCVPGGPSIACSTPTAIAWDASFANRADPSGRSIMGVHVEEYE